MIVPQALRECQLFAGLPYATLEKIASLIVEKEYEPGTIILREGESAEELFIVQEGKVALQMTLPIPERQMSRKLTADILTKNEMLGWSAIVEPFVYTFTGVCLQKTRVFSISGAKLRWLLEDNPKIGYELLKGLIKVVASRLEETRQLLIAERSVTLKTEQA
ncbi:MAG: cAMP-binding protein [Dehalococcoidales bacterium]|nr:cAMP-binding protein [Dehalococcoidales bacterium]